MNDKRGTGRTKRMVERAKAWHEAHPHERMHIVVHRMDFKPYIEQLWGGPLPKAVSVIPVSEHSPQQGRYAPSFWDHFAIEEEIRLGFRDKMI